MGVNNWHYHSDTNSYEVRGWSGGEDTGRLFRITFPEGCEFETHSYRCAAMGDEPTAVTCAVLRLLDSRVRTTQDALYEAQEAQYAAFDEEGKEQTDAAYWAINDSLAQAATQTFTADDAAMLAKAVSDDNEDGYENRHGYAASQIVHTGNGKGNKTFTEAEALVAFRKLVGTCRTRR